MSEPSELKAFVAEYYKKLFVEEGVTLHDPTLMDHHFPSLTMEQLNNLNKPYSPKEV